MSLRHDQYTAPRSLGVNGPPKPYTAVPAYREPDCPALLYCCTVVCAVLCWSVQYQYYIRREHKQYNLHMSTCTMYMLKPRTVMYVVLSTACL